MPSWHYCPLWVTALCMSLGLLVLAWSTGCRLRPPAAEAAPKPPVVAAPRQIQPAQPVHVNRPHGPAYRLDNGLGSPVA
jgi:hypothetical protein